MKKTILFALITFTITVNAQNGMLDQSFNIGSGTDNVIKTISIQSDGKIIIGGYFTTYNGTTINNVARLNINGILDTSFHTGTGNSTVLTTAIQSDGKIIIGGAFATYNGTASNHLARINMNGSIDTSFHIGTGANSFVETCAIQSDGKIIIGGIFASYDGTTSRCVARLNNNGALDTSFHVGTGINTGGGSISTCSIQNDGKIIIAGNFTSYNGISINSIARLNTDGSIDTTFNVGTGASGGINTIVIQSDGKIIIGGAFTTYNGITSNHIARINTNGSLDNTFNVGTGINVNNTVLTTAIQPDGKIIIGGSFINYNGTSINRLARINTNGILDNTFNIGAGANSDVNTCAIQRDGNIIIGGGFTSYNGTASNYIARIIGRSASICLVTVDTLGLNNIVVWDKTQYTGVDSFIVYRYDVFSSNYLRIGAVPYDSLSEFIDTARSIGAPNGGDPQYSGYRYKLAMRDTFGNIGAMSPYHQTMFIQQNNQNFSWTAYTIENGTPVTGYQFLRRDNPTSNYHVLVNTQNLSSTDPNYANYPNGNWIVQVLNFNCTATRASVNYNSSKSNTAGIIANPNGIKPLSENYISVYPNPFQNTVSVKMKTDELPAQFSLYNIIGESISSSTINHNNQQIEMNLKSGIYFYSIKTNGNKIFNGKLIKN